MWISFEHPGWLIALVLLAPIWLITLRASGTGWGKMKSWSISRRAVMTASIRSVVIALLVAALSQPSVVQSSDGITVVIVADASRSVSTKLRADTQTWLQEIVADRSRKIDRLAVVTFAKNAEIQSNPQSNPNINIQSHADLGIGSDLASGVRMAMANRWFFTALALVASLATAITYGLGGNLPRPRSAAQAYEAAAAGPHVGVFPRQVVLPALPGWRPRRRPSCEGSLPKC